MALGRREGQSQETMWIATWDLPTSPGHPFYEKLNGLLAKAGFDKFVEALCKPFYADGVGRPGIAPGVYFRMLLVGYFEGLDSQRGIAWRCADSLSLRAFLGVRLGEQTPDHSSLTVIRQRLPLEVHQQVFVKILDIARAHGLVKGKRVAIDATTLEANAAMKGIVRKASGEDWKAYLARLAKEAGIDDPSDEDLRRFDRKRQDKKVSNDDWHSPSDPDSRIVRMKDGRTHLGYKAEHAIDLDTRVLLAAEIHAGDRSDCETVEDTLVQAQRNVYQAGADVEIEELAADKGYHKTENLAVLEAWLIRTYIAEPKSTRRRRWVGRPEGQREAVYGNRRRCRGDYGKGLQRLRSEQVERSFAHTCDTGGARRRWIRGLIENAKRYLITGAGHNLGVIMEKVFGVGKPRALQGAAALAELLHAAVSGLYGVHTTLIRLVRPVIPSECVGRAFFQTRIASPVPMVTASRAA